MGKADLHIHTTYSDGTGTVPAILEWAANFTGLDVIAITDHDVLHGALEALDLAPKFGIEVIPGCEITTRDGHLLALFIQKPIPRGLSMLESVLRVGEQGGVCIPAHPTDAIAHGASRAVIQNILRHPDARQVMVGLETINTGIWNQQANPRAQRIASAYSLAATGGSDSHVFWTVGSGYTTFPGFHAQDLRRALLERSTAARRASGRRVTGYWARHAFSFMLRRAGWVTWTPAPNDRLRLHRLPETIYPNLPALSLGRSEIPGLPLSPVA